MSAQRAVINAGARQQLRIKAAVLQGMKLGLSLSQVAKQSGYSYGQVKAVANKLNRGDSE